jgi:hypothetical protein
MEFEEETEENYQERKKFYNELDGNMVKLYKETYEKVLEEKQIEYEEFLDNLNIAKDISSNYTFISKKINYIDSKKTMTWVDAMVYAYRHKYRLPNHHEADIIKRMEDGYSCFWTIHSDDKYAYDSDNEVHKFDSRSQMSVYLIEFENQET